MASAVRASLMALRLFWIINLGLGIYIAFIAASPAPQAWVTTHMFTGILVIIFVWFLGIAQALVKGGSLVLTVTTFIIGLALAIIGMFQLAAADGSAALYTLQGLHVILVLSTIALGEVCASRYRKGIAATQAA